MTESGRGYIAALAAFLIWGAFPLYWKLLAEIPAFETLMHRIVWTVPVCLVIILATQRVARVMEIFTNMRLLGLMTLSTLLIATNWGTYIWSVSNDRVLEASLGYFMSPLVNVICGVIFFAERLNRLQMISVCLAAMGVASALIVQGSLPIVALILSISFGLYGVVRKYIPTGSVSGLAAETLILLPLALGYLVWLQSENRGVFLNMPLDTHLILLCAGLVTAIPLILYVEGAKRLTMTAMGIMFYITPSVLFLQSTFLYGEEVTLDKAILFGFIWASLLVYSYDLVTNMKIQKKTGRP